MPAATAMTPTAWAVTAQWCLLAATMTGPPTGRESLAESPTYRQPGMPGGYRQAPHLHLRGPSPVPFVRLMGYTQPWYSVRGVAAPPTAAWRRLSGFWLAEKVIAAAFGLGMLAETAGPGNEVVGNEVVKLLPLPTITAGELGQGLAILPGAVHHAVA